jgi:hypothetical protein
MAARAAITCFAKQPDSEGWTVVKVDPLEAVATLKKLIVADLHVRMRPDRVTLSIEGCAVHLDDTSVVQDVLADRSRILLHAPPDDSAGKLTECSSRYGRLW